jgi:hypothetical protein
MKNRIDSSRWFSWGIQDGKIGIKVPTDFVCIPPQYRRDYYDGYFLGLFYFFSLEK